MKIRNIFTNLIILALFLLTGVTNVNATTYEIPEGYLDPITYTYDLSDGNASIVLYPGDTLKVERQTPANENDQYVVGIIPHPDYATETSNYYTDAAYITENYAIAYQSIKITGEYPVKVYIGGYGCGAIDSPNPTNEDWKKRATGFTITQLSSYYLDLEYTLDSSAIIQGYDPNPTKIYVPRTGDDTFIPLKAPVKEGLKFQKWQFNAGLAYNANGIYVKDLNFNATGNYANPIFISSDSNGHYYGTVKLNANNGTIEGLNSKIYEIEFDNLSAFDLSDYTPVKNGYTFSGWYSDQELTTRINSLSDLSSTFYGSQTYANRKTTLYAKWVLTIPATYHLVADMSRLSSILTNATVEGNTITLTEDVDLIEDTITFTSGEYVIDLNGYKITSNAKKLIEVNGENVNLTIKDTSASKQGKIITTKDYRTASSTGGEYTYVTPLRVSSGTVTINSGTFLSTGTGINVTGGTVTINDGTFGSTYGVIGAYLMGNITINNGNFIGNNEDGVGIFTTEYQNITNNLTINNAKASGSYGMDINIDNSNNLTHNIQIKDGTYTGYYTGLFVYDTTIPYVSLSGGTYISTASDADDNFGGIHIWAKTGNETNPYTLKNLLANGYNYSPSTFTLIEDNPGTYYTKTASNVFIGVEYDITPVTNQNGTVLVTKGAAEEDTVKFIIKPNQGYELDEVQILKESDNSDITSLVNYNATNHTFEMPNYDVKINATFKLITIENAPVVTITNSSYSSLKLSWENIYGAQGYKIYRATSKTGKYVLIKTITNGNILTYTNTYLKLGQAYYYKVQAYNQKGSGPLSVYKYNIVRPASPVLKTISGWNSITVSWNKVSGATGYKLYRATSLNGTYKLIKTTTKTSFANTGLILNKTYYYKAVAYKIVNNKTYSSLSSSKVFGTPYLKKTTLTASDNYYRYIKASWTKVSGATGYIVYRSTSENGTYKELTKTKNNYYYDYSAVENQTYYYKVLPYRVINNVRYNGKIYSNIDSGIRLNDTINFNLSSSNSSSALITIEKISNATKYYIYRATSKTGTYSLIKTLNASDFTGNITYTNTGLSTSKMYYYKVKALYKNETAFTNYKYIITKLSTPTLTIRTGASFLATKLTMTNVLGRVGYEIYRSDTLDGTYSLLKTTTSTTYEYELSRADYQARKPYYYKVRAYKIVNNVKVYSNYTEPQVFIPE